MSTLVANCPYCFEEVEFDDDVELSEVVVCKHCDRECEVVSLDPPALQEWEEEEK